VAQDTNNYNLSHHLRFHQFIQQHLGLGGQQMRTVCIAIVQSLLGLLQIVVDLPGRRLLVVRQCPLD